MNEQLKENEKIEEINDGLRVIRSPGQLPFGTDALLLASFLRGGARKKAAELGAGTGAVSLLAAARGKFARIDGFELQESAVGIFRRNLALNALEKRVNIFRADIRSLPSGLCGAYDCVFSNPPYMKCGAGRSSPSIEREAARHETAGDIFDFAAAAARLLKTGGEAVFVYRPDRLCDLVDAFRTNGLEPKRLTLVCADEAHAPSIALLAGKKGAARGLFVSPVLFLSDTAGQRSADYLDILGKGVFPQKYVKP